MARASVSWVLQRYKDGPEAEYVRFTANGRTTTKRLNEATQFARRVDAMNVAAFMWLDTDIKAREKVIG
jgi:hypothetical protein